MPNARHNGVPVNRLEEVLQAAFRDPGHRPEFYRLLLESDLYVVGEAAAAKSGEQVAGPNGQKVSIAGWKRDGKTLVPAFTSLERLSESESRAASCIQLNGRALLELLAPRTTVLLNPGCPLGKELPPEELKALLDGTLFDLPDTERVPEGTPVVVGPPPEEPRELILALRTLFAKHSGVQAAFVAQIRLPGEQELPHLLVGLLGDGDVRPVIAEASLVAKSLLKPGEPIDFLDVGADEASLRLVEKTPPFYVR